MANPSHAGTRPSPDNYLTVFEKLTMEVSEDVGPQERRGIPQAGGDAESTKEQVVVKVVLFKIIAVARI